MTPPHGGFIKMCVGGILAFEASFVSCEAERELIHFYSSSVFPAQTLMKKMMNMIRIIIRVILEKSGTLWRDSFS